MYWELVVYKPLADRLKLFAKSVLYFMHITPRDE